MPGNDDSARQAAGSFAPGVVLDPGSPGDALRAMPLPKAYNYVEDIRIRLKNSPYSNNTDVAYLTAYSLLSPDEAWKDVLEKITLVRFPDCPSLHIALEKSFAVHA